MLRMRKPLFVVLILVLAALGWAQVHRLAEGLPADRPEDPPVVVDQLR